MCHKHTQMHSECYDHLVHCYNIWSITRHRGLAKIIKSQQFQLFFPSSTARTREERNPKQPKKCHWLNKTPSTIVKAWAILLGMPIPIGQKHRIIEAWSYFHKQISWHAFQRRRSGLRTDPVTAAKALRSKSNCQEVFPLSKTDTKNVGSI